MRSYLRFAFAFDAGNEGHQPGDPAKAAQALFALVASPNPRVQLFLGADALELVGQKLEAMQAELAAWDALSRSTSFV